MAVTRYIGEYVEAEDAQRYIDITSIEESCRELIKEAESIDKIKDNVTTASEYCSKENFYLLGTSVEDEIAGMGSNIKDSSDTIKEYAHALLSKAYTALDNKQIELNEEARIQDEIKIQEAAELKAAQEKAALEKAEELRKMEESSRTQSVDPITSPSTTTKEVKEEDPLSSIEGDEKNEQR